MCVCVCPVVVTSAVVQVVAHLRAVGNGDRRLNRFRAWLQWFVAFGGHTGPSWETIVAGAAAGNTSYEHFASAGELLGQLITADGAIPTGSTRPRPRERHTATHTRPRLRAPAVLGSRRPDRIYSPACVCARSCGVRISSVWRCVHCDVVRAHTLCYCGGGGRTVDSILLLEQTHFWPRGSAWDVSDDGYAPSMVAPCDAETRPTTGNTAEDAALLHVRTHRVPEFVDLRVQRGNKRTRFGAAWRSSRDIPHALYEHLAADAAGSRPCVRDRKAGMLCTSCEGSHAAKLCACATLLRYPDRRTNPLSAMTRPDFHTEKVHMCCRASSANASALG